MEEILAQILSLAKSAWRFRWIGLIVAWIVATVGTVVVTQIPNRFEASARIYVDTQSILKPLMQGLAIQPNINQQVEMLSRTLISRPNLEKLIRMADLDLKSNSKTERESLIESLAKEVQIRSTGRDNLYTLNYSNSDKEKGKRVIQSLTSIFVESSLGANRKDTDTAKVFLDEQIKNYEAKLQEAENRLQEFRLKNLDVRLASDGKDAATRMSEMSQLLERARLELKEAENARDAAKQQLAEAQSGAKSATAMPSMLSDPASLPSNPEIDSRLDALRRNLDALLQRYTDQHPDVIIIRRQIKELEEQKRKELEERRKAAAAAAASASGPTLDSSNPLVAALTPMLANAEAQVAALRARVAEYSGRLAQAKAQVRNSPQLETEGMQLNRDYGIIKKNYEDLVARRQSATLSGELEMASGVVDFRLIDPPRVGDKPVSPNRILLLGVVLIATIAAGVTAAFATSLLRPMFHDGAELRNKTGLPLLGIVSFSMNDAERRKERLGYVRFLAGSGSLMTLMLIGMLTAAILSARQVG